MRSRSARKWTSFRKCWSRDWKREFEIDLEVEPEEDTESESGEEKRRTGDEESAADVEQGEDSGELEIETGRSHTTSKVVKWRKKRLNIEFLPNMELYLDRELRRGEFSAAVRANSKDDDLDERGYYMLSLKHGSGRVTLLNHAQPLRNRYLSDADHARWLSLLVGRDWRDVRFVLGFEGSFWSLLWEKAWAPLLGISLLTLLWLWKNLPRFGPIREVRLHETQRFADHLSALGPFYLRIKRPNVLLTAAREAVQTRVQRTLPQLMTVDDEALFKVLAERSQLSLDRVRAAMHSPQLIAEHRRNLTVYLQDLQTLRNSL